MIIAAKEMSQVSDKEGAAICLQRVGLEVLNSSNLFLPVACTIKVLRS
jgi:hypothetical protein